MTASILNRKLLTIAATDCKSWKPTMLCMRKEGRLVPEVIMSLKSEGRENNEKGEKFMLACSLACM